MNSDELTERVRELRMKGCSPKEIARALGVQPATVATIVRVVAAADEGNANGTVKCWVSPGWSTGLLVDRPDWPDVDTASSTGSGLANVLVAREEKGTKVSVCGYLVDVFCLGVKDIIGPRMMNRSAVPELSAAFFSAYRARPLVIPLELAQHLVLGAVEFARDLGFAPAAGFDAIRGYLEPWTGPSAIRFGLQGKPFFIQGPYDNAARIHRTLERSVGDGNFHFTSVPAR